MKSVTLNLAAGIILASVLFLAGYNALAQNNFGLDDTANVAFNSTGIPHDGSKVDLVLTVGKLVNVALSFLGVIFLILVIYGGFLWMTAGGSEEKVGKAVAIFTNSSLGLMIVIAAYLATRYIGTAIINSLK